MAALRELPINQFITLRSQSTILHMQLRKLELFSRMLDQLKKELKLREPSLRHLLQERNWMAALKMTNAESLSTAQLRATQLLLLTLVRNYRPSIVLLNNLRGQTQKIFPRSNLESTLAKRVSVSLIKSLKTGPVANLIIDIIFNI